MREAFTQITRQCFDALEEYYPNLLAYDVLESTEQSVLLLLKDEGIPEHLDGMFIKFQIVRRSGSEVYVNFAEADTEVVRAEVSGKARTHQVLVRGTLA